MAPTPDRIARFAQAYGSGRTVAEAADEVGISERQGLRWLNLPGVRDQARRVQAETADPTALSTLRGLLTSRSETVRLGAARALLLARVDESEGRADGHALPEGSIVIHPEASP